MFKIKDPFISSLILLRYESFWNLVCFSHNLKDNVTVS